MSSPAPGLDAPPPLRLVPRRRDFMTAAWWTRRRVAAAAATLVLVAVTAALLGRPSVPPGVASAVARDGPFRVTLVESGTLQALRSITYSSTIVSNQAKIVGLVPEGKLVQKGDLLILFDAAPFQDEIRRSEALLAQAQAEHERATQDYNLQLAQNQEEVATARQKLERSRLELQDVVEGKGRLREQEAQAAVMNAERELSKVKAAHEDLQPLLAEGFITRQELDRAAQAVERAAEDLELARQRQQSLLRFGRPVELSQARADAELTEDTLRQLGSTARFRLDQKKAAIAAAASRVHEASSRLALVKDQLARTEVRADVAGIVVYRPVFQGNEQRKPQVGDQVWANQPLLILPDVSRMVVETRVRETDVHKVTASQRVAVSVDAYPDLRLHGKVTLVGTLAQEAPDRQGARFFGVTVELDGTDPRLRPGMTARVEILVEERAKAVHVPLDAVFEREGRTIVWVAGRAGVEAREVVLGPSNANFVVVERGLAAGEIVCLSEPGAATSEASTSS